MTEALPCISSSAETRKPDLGRRAPRGQQWRLRRGLRGDARLGRAAVGLDDIARGFRTGTAAVRYRQSLLHFIEGGGAALYALADLAIANTVTEANVHGDLGCAARRNQNTNANDCQLLLGRLVVSSSCGKL